MFIILVFKDHKNDIYHAVLLNITDTIPAPSSGKALGFLTTGPPGKSYSLCFGFFFPLLNFYFLMWTILKGLVEFVTIHFCFIFWLFGPSVCGIFWGFPGGSDGKEHACSVGDPGSNP